MTKQQRAELVDKISQYLLNRYGPPASDTLSAKEAAKRLVVIMEKHLREVV